jgi:hypothetical protein
VAKRVRSDVQIDTETAALLARLGARIDLYGALGAVHKTIYAVESGKPYLFVSTASIRLSPSISAQAGMTEPVIDAQLNVFGAMQMEAPVR